MTDEERSARLLASAISILKSSHNTFHYNHTMTKANAKANNAALKDAATRSSFKPWVHTPGAEEGLTAGEPDDKIDADDADGTVPTTTEGTKMDQVTANEKALADKKAADKAAAIAAKAEAKERAAADKKEVDRVKAEAKAKVDAEKAAAKQKLADDKAAAEAGKKAEAEAAAKQTADERAAKAAAALDERKAKILADAEAKIANLKAGTTSVAAHGMGSLAERVKAGHFVKGANGQLRTSDEIAVAMEVVPKEQTVAVLAHVLAIDVEAKYANLNYGQKSMNLRNIARGRLRKEVAANVAPTTLDRLNDYIGSLPKAA